jgi:hypothetical protein
MSLKNFLSNIFIVVGLTAMILAAMSYSDLPACAQSVTSYSIKAQIKPDDTMDVYETIVVDFGPDGSPGFYRIIPLGSRIGKFRHQFHFKLVNAEEERGQSSYRQIIQEDSAIVEIGGTERLLKGLQVFKLHYVLRQVIDFSRGLTFQWDPVGEGLSMPMEALSVFIRTPFDARVESINSRALLQQNGQVEHLVCERDPEGISLQAKNIPPGHSLLLSMDLPPNSVHAPNLSRQLGWFLADWWPAIVLPLLALLSLVAVLWTGRRIEETSHPIKALLRLRETLTPAELGTLLDDRCDLKDVTATLFDLAARGYLTIEEIESDNLASFSNRDYIFKRVPEKDESGLFEHEKLVMSALFSPDQLEPNEDSRLSELKSSFFKFPSGVEAAVYRSLITKGQLFRMPSEITKSYLAGGAGLLLAGLMLATAKESVAVALGIGLSLSGLITCFLAPSMPARTILGSRSFAQAKQLQHFLLTAQKSRIKALFDGHGSAFGRYLSYALVMGAADKLAESLHDVMWEMPNWYRPYYDGIDREKISGENFVTSLGSGMRTIERTFALSRASSSGYELDVS